MNPELVTAIAEELLVNLTDAPSAKILMFYVDGGGDIQEFKLCSVRQLVTLAQYVIDSRVVTP